MNLMEILPVFWTVVQESLSTQPQPSQLPFVVLVVLFSSVSYASMHHESFITTCLIQFCVQEYYSSIKIQLVRTHLFDSEYVCIAQLPGKILNRFSKDIGFLDDLLPYTFCEFILVSHNISVLCNDDIYHYSYFFVA